MRDTTANPSDNVIRFSEVVSALSHALDLTEGQAIGHSARTCILGMRIAREIGLEAANSTALFYGLLLKDLGCSSNASKVCCLFGADDRAVKCDMKITNWRKTADKVKYVARNVQPESSLLRKAVRVAGLAMGGERIAKELVQMRCSRGADIARSLQLPEETAEAIQSLDEHWDGGGHAAGLAGEQIPLLARIMGLAQTAEVFWAKGGPRAAAEVVAERSGTWFDPQLAEVFCKIHDDIQLIASMNAADSTAEATRLEPMELTLPMNDQATDRLAEGFARVIDAKSPWTFCHSTGVADVSVGIANVLGLESGRIQQLRRAALLHDIGKLGVSNLILDKPGKLTPEELTAMRRHPEFTFSILSRVKCFAHFAEMSAGHHERMDGRGYHRGISGRDISLGVRILGVADMYEALAARRPYRQDLSREDVMTILKRETGTGLCPSVVSALECFLNVSNFVPHQLAA